VNDARFLEAFDLAHTYIERTWGIPVRVHDVPNPFTGDLDGAEIHVDHELEPEDALFVLVHLFGHTVQWNLSAELREIGSVRGPGLSAEVLAELAQYERQACRYGLQILHEVGVRDLDQWLADFAACDLAYVVHFQEHGEKRAFRSFWRDGQPLLEPLPIPEFHPTRWVSRWEGVVI
jgi:hypothetical protein